MSEEAEVQFEHDGIDYVVTARYEVVRVDDSFTGHLGGFLYDYEAHHWEIDPDTLDVISCIGGLEEDEDVEPESVKGLMDVIIDRLTDQHERHQ